MCLIKNFFKLENSWILFYDLFSKNYNGDSIRPIAEEIRQQMPDAKLFFVCSNKNKVNNIDMADEVLVENSLKFKYVCNKAKYIISPMAFPKIKKRKGQVFVQTWHGSPLKKLYLSRNKNDKHNLRYASRFADTDIFCSQGEIHNKHLAEALNLNKSQIYNTGLPRNDILFKDTTDLIKSIKNQLGLPDNKKVLFYCPTWRRADRKAQLPFNLKKLKENFANEYVILIRSHVGKHSWVDENDNPISIFDNEFSFDGGSYPEVTHLYAVSDVLITDYSSSFFDYAITNKPQIFYAYDLEDYTNTQGLYFDYKDIVPGDIPTNTDELIESIKTLPKYYEKYGSKLEEFRNKYIEAEKGDATKQVIDFMLKIGKQ